MAEVNLNLALADENIVWGYAAWRGLRVIIVVGADDVTDMDNYLAEDTARIYQIAADRYQFEQKLANDYLGIRPSYVFKPAPPIQGMSKPTNP